MAPPGFPGTFQGPPGHLTVESQKEPESPEPESESEQEEPETAADRLRGITIVRTALSERMLERLREAGIDESPRRRREEVETEDMPMGVANHLRCSRLGLEDSTNLESLVPAQKKYPPSLPACTPEIALGGLWDKFRLRCGKELPPDPAPLQCGLRSSRGGGSVVVPLAHPALAL